MLLLLTAAALARALSAPTLAGAHVGLLAVDARTGTVLASQNADDDFRPASTMKLLTASAALDDLGIGFTFVTTLESDGTNLYVRGGGDPYFSSSDLQTAAGALAAQNLRAFGGGIVADVSRYGRVTYPDGWQVDDLPYDYAALPSALTVDGNAAPIKLAATSPGSAAEATLSPRLRDVPIENDATTGVRGSDDTTALQRDAMRSKTEITGSIPAGTASELDASLADPAAAFVDALERTLGSSVTFAAAARYADTPPAAHILWTHVSPAMPEMLARMLLPSDNLAAETLLLELGRAGSGNDLRANGIEREREWLRSIGVDPRSVFISDGSGMSCYDELTPRALVQIVRHDLEGSRAAVLAGALPTAGRSGTLSNAFEQPPLAGALHAKTGTATHVRALSGYLDSPAGRIVFALTIDGWMDSGPGSGDRLRAAQAAILVTLPTHPRAVPERSKDV